MVKKINFIVSSNTFETFYKLLILGTTGAAMDIEINAFFTFWGLYLLKKGYKPRVSGAPLGMNGMATGMFKKEMVKAGMEDPEEMLRDAVEDGKLKLIPCSMTLDILSTMPLSFNLKKEDLYDFVEEPVGAATFYELCEGADTVIHM